MPELTLYGNNYQKMELEFFNGAQWIPDPRNVVKNGFYLVLALIVKEKNYLYHMCNKVPLRVGFQPGLFNLR